MRPRGLIVWAGALLVLQVGCAPAGPVATPTPAGTSGSRGAVPPASLELHPDPLPTDLEQPPFAGRIGPAGGPGAADLQGAASRCEGPGPNNRVVDLSWTPATRRGSEQRVNLSYFRDGFDTGRFLTSGPLPPGQSAYTWRELNPGDEPRYWRVLTRHGDGYTPGPTGTFAGPTC